jgi:hypothetical protein
MSKKKKQFDKEQFKLNINEAMMFGMQAATGHSTHKIIEYFYNIMQAQKKEIENSPNEVSAGTRRYSISTKKSYGFYPETKIHFVASTNWKDVALEEDNGHFGSRRVAEYRLWECTVAAPRNMVSLDHDKLKEVIAEGFLIGGGEPELNSPQDKPRRLKDAVEKLQTDTDSK